MFQLDDRLEQDGPMIENLIPDFYVICKQNAHYPWLVLVPTVPGATELFHLNELQRNGLFNATAALSKALKAVTAADKMNVHSIGNVVSQLHVHIISRKKDDPLWPNPVWREAPKEGSWIKNLDEFKANLKRELARAWS